LANIEFCGARSAKYFGEVEVQLNNLYRALGISFEMPRKFSRDSRRRFFNFHTKELIDSLDHEMTQADVLLINRVVRNMWELLRQDALLDSGKPLSEHAERYRAAGENRLRLDLRALSLYPVGGPLNHSRPRSKPDAKFEDMLATLMAERDGP
jgi:hypothetical protein